MGQLAGKAYVVVVFRLVPEVALIDMHNSLSPFMHISVVTVSLSMFVSKEMKYYCMSMYYKNTQVFFVVVFNHFGILIIKKNIYIKNASSYFELL